MKTTDVENIVDMFNSIDITEAKKIMDKYIEDGFWKEYADMDIILTIEKLKKTDNRDEFLGTLIMHLYLSSKSSNNEELLEKVTEFFTFVFKRTQYDDPSIELNMVDAMQMLFTLNEETKNIYLYMFFAKILEEM